MLNSHFLRLSTILSTVLFLVTFVQGSTHASIISPSTLDNLSEFIRLEQQTKSKTNTAVVQPVFKTKTDQTFTYIDAFLQGFRSNDVLPSAQNCSKGLRDSINVWNATKQSFNNQTSPLYGNKLEQTFAYTHWISYKLAPASRNCFLTSMQGYQYYQNKTEQFAASNSSLFSSWLSNLLGNSITLNSIYKKIQDAKAANDTVATYYWYGRLTNILVIFSPLTEDNFEEQTVPNKSKKLLAEILSLLEAQGTSALAAARQRPKKPKPKPKATVLQPLQDDQYNVTDSSNTTEQDLPEKQQPSLSNFFYNSYFFLRGFQSYAFDQASPNGTICSGNITDLLHYSAKLYNEIGYVNTTENITASADDFENILQTVYPITFSCYYGVVEYKIASKQYVETVKTPKKILNNLIRNAGKLYDSIFFLVKWVKLDTSVYFTSEQVYNYWYKMGGYIGLMLYLALYNFGSLAVWSITNANTTTKNATVTKF